MPGGQHDVDERSCHDLYHDLRHRDVYHEIYHETDHEIDHEIDQEICLDLCLCVERAFVVYISVTSILNAGLLQ